ncbi:hypothetical protein ACHQM5_023001 [Ranunculus cassubicifolius]
MFQAMKIARSQPNPIFNSQLPSFGRKSCIVRYPLVKFCSTASQPDNLDNKEMSGTQEHKKEGDVMSHSFGEGYSTRADEEGFGGVYSGNQSLPKSKDTKEVHENHPDYDQSQGSHVKEKEGGRNQQSTS